MQATRLTNHCLILPELPSFLHTEEENKIKPGGAANAAPPGLMGGIVRR
ncbi:hypothetical protein BACCAP_00939 [Pseudoflavonifractor capillosus ATCC 29799]|uniref:Uncharacterized protein n=1 Tax=Pseudoflavonifractor capillosus ATCC 29799 TaxID=411467 RepID=A6NRW1_9FIRM|nr:hypothetical protein BACCAP_00939 [Pseudoflavonifractor capillosus ATCC 29799]